MSQEYRFFLFSVCAQAAQGPILSLLCERMQSPSRGQALRSLRVRKLQLVTPAEFQSFCTELWFSASDYESSCFQFALRPREAHPFGFGRKDVKSEQRAGFAQLSCPKAATRNPCRIPKFSALSFGSVPQTMNLPVFRLRSGRAGPILSVSAERMRSMGVSCFPPLHTPKSPHQAISCPWGLTAFPCTAQFFV